MARFAMGMLLGVVVGVVGGAALGLHADEDQVALAAEESGIDPIKLLGAVNATGLEPRAYLCMTGEGPCPKPPPLPLNLSVERRLDCIQQYESHGFAGATNPRSKAAGLFQFLWSTWSGTPQGRAGLSPYDAIAARNAARWMAGQGRWTEWVPVQLGLC